jgi:hypothetical protein
MGALSGAESFGKDANIDPSHPDAKSTWFKVADYTLTQMLQQLDNSCGGIYFHLHKILFIYYKY